MLCKVYRILSIYRNQCSCFSNTVFTITYNNTYASQCKPFQCFYFTSSILNSRAKDDPMEEKTEIKIKRPPIPKVTLLGPKNNIVTVAPLEEVRRIAEKKDLRLVKIVDLDVRSQRPIYKMMTEAQYLEEDYQNKKEMKSAKEKHVIKGNKLSLISDRINEADLESRIKKLVKWIMKKYEVRVIISFTEGNTTNAERICEIVEKAVLKCSGRIVQKRQKENDIRLSVLPPKELVEVGTDEKHEDVQ